MSMSIAEKSQLGCYIGAGIALVPAATTFLIASSRAILIDILANAILKVLSGGTVGIKFYGLSLIQVPILWKISLICGVIGGGIVALSLLAAMVNTVYLRMSARQN